MLVVGPVDRRPSRRGRARRSRTRAARVVRTRAVTVPLDPRRSRTRCSRDAELRRATSGRTSSTSSAASSAGSSSTAARRRSGTLLDAGSRRRARGQRRCRKPMPSSSSARRSRSSGETRTISEPASTRARPAGVPAVGVEPTRRAPERDPGLLPRRALDRRRGRHAARARSRWSLLLAGRREPATTASGTRPSTASCRHSSRCRPRPRVAEAGLTVLVAARDEEARIGTTVAAAAPALPRRPGGRRRRRLAGRDGRTSPPRRARACCGSRTAARARR